MVGIADCPPGNLKVCSQESSWDFLSSLCGAPGGTLQPHELIKPAVAARDPPSAQSGHTETAEGQEIGSCSDKTRVEETD